MANERTKSDWKPRASDLKFEAIFMAMDEGVVLLGRSGEILAVNPAAENILGMAATELIGRSAAECVQTLNCITEDATPLSPELHPAVLALQTGKPQRNVLVGMYRPDGTQVWLSINAQPMALDSEAGLHGVVTTFRDVTERKCTEDALSFVAQRGWVDSNENFFDALAQYLGKTLGVDYVMVSRLTDAPGIVETVASYAKGSLVQNIRYDLKGTPCENVIGRKFCFYPQGIQQTFPEDALLVEMGASSYAGLPLWDSTGQPIGLIAVLDGKPLRDEALVSQVLQFMAPRAAAELERERNERVLQKSEREFRALADNMPDGVVRHDRQARVQYLNRALLASVPPEFSAVVGESLVETFPGNEAKADLHRLIQRVIETGASAQVEFQLPTLRGEMRTHEVRYVAERDRNGEIVGALGIGRDITEQRVSERQLRETLEFTEGVINAIPDLLFEADRDGICLNVWARTPELLAMHQEALLGKRISDVVAPDTAEVALSALREADEKGLSFGKVLRVVIPQGERWFELSVSKKPGSDEPGRFIVLSRDVTGRKRMEDDIRRRELEFRSLAENMPDNVVRYDRQARVVYMNPAIIDNVAPHFRPVLGQSPIETYPGREGAAGHQRIVEQVIATGMPAEWEFQTQNPHGEIRIHHARYVAERDDNGEIVGVLGLGRDITERKRMEDDIRRRELEFRSLAENMPDNVIRHDRQARVQYVNPALIANVAPEFLPVLGESVTQTYPGNDGAAWCERVVEQVIATGVPAEIEFQMPNLLGEMRLNQVRYVAERDGGGEIVGALGIGRDITERKLAEEYEQFRSQTLELLAGGAPLQSVLEGIVRGVEQLKPEMMCSILLLDSQGKRLGDGIAPSLPDFYNAAVNGLEIGVGVGCCGTAAATGERVIVSDIMTHPYWASYKELTTKAGLGACWSEPIHSSTGQVLGTFAVYHREPYTPKAFDISIIEKSVHLVSIAIERKQAEEALRRSEREFRTLAENLPDPLVRYDREGRRTYVSPVLERKFAVTAEPMLGKTLPETNPTGMPMPEIYQRALEHTLSTGERSEFELLIAPRGESMRTYLCFMVAERAEDGQISGAIATSRDITERKRAETELEQHRQHLEKMVKERTRDLSIAKETAEAATQAKSRFLAAASHDLRQPISAIGLFNDALAQSGLNDEQSKMSRNLTRAVNSLGEMLNELLDIAKLDAGKLEPRPAVIQSGELLETIASEFDSVAREKNLRFKCHFPQRNLALFTDRNLLLTILRNLIGNAVKYTEQGGILVSFRKRGNCALIQVWDTGIGISPTQLDLIFEEYFQANNTERNRAKGAGLGLSIVKRVSEALGNRVSCRSRLGRGSVFEISLPLAQDMGQQAIVVQTCATSEGGALHRLAGKRIVVIEDDAMTGEALKSLLERHGGSVTLFGTAEHALGSMEAMDADHYISDYHLRDMNGLQLLDAIQKRSAEPIKALLLTGNTSLDQTQSSRWKILFKPIALPELLSAMEL